MNRAASFRHGANANGANNNGGNNNGRGAALSRQSHQQQLRATLAASLRGPLYANATNGSVVIDIGSRTVKVGIVGDAAPSLVIKTPPRLAQLMLMGSTAQRAGGLLLASEASGIGGSAGDTTTSTAAPLLATEVAAAIGVSASPAGLTSSVSAKGNAAITDARSTAALALAAAGGASSVGGGGPSSSADAVSAIGDSSSNPCSSPPVVTTDIAHLYEAEVAALMSLLSARGAPIVGAARTPIYLRDVDACPQLTAAVEGWLGAHTDAGIGRLHSSALSRAYTDGRNGYQPDLTGTAGGLAVGGGAFFSAINNNSIVSASNNNNDNMDGGDASAFNLSRIGSLRRSASSARLLTAAASFRLNAPLVPSQLQQQQNNQHLAPDGSGGGGLGAAVNLSASPLALTDGSGGSPHQSYHSIGGGGGGGGGDAPSAFSLSRIHRSAVAGCADVGGASLPTPVSTAPMAAIAYFAPNVAPAVGLRGGNDYYAGNNPRSKFSINNYANTTAGGGDGSGEDGGGRDGGMTWGEGGGAAGGLLQMIGEAANSGGGGNHHGNGNHGAATSALAAAARRGGDAFASAPSSPALLPITGGGGTNTTQSESTLPVPAAGSPSLGPNIIDGGTNEENGTPIFSIGAGRRGSTSAAAASGLSPTRRASVSVGGVRGDKPAMDVDGDGSRAATPIVVVTAHNNDATNGFRSGADTPVPAAGPNAIAAVGGAPDDVRRALDGCISVIPCSAAANSAAAMGGGGGGLGLRSVSNLRGGMAGGGGESDSFGFGGALASSSASPLAAASPVLAGSNFGNPMVATAGGGGGATATNPSSLPAGIIPVVITPTQKRALVTSPSPSTSVSHYYRPAAPPPPPKKLTPAGGTTASLPLAPTVNGNPLLSHNTHTRPSNGVLTLSLQASSLTAYGLRSGLVLDLGWKSVRATPIIHNCCDSRLAAPPCFWGLRNVIYALRRQIMEDNAAKLCGGSSSNSNSSDALQMQQLKERQHRAAAASEALLSDDLLHDFILQFGVVAPPVGHPRREAVLHAAYPIVLKTSLVYGKPNLALETLFTGAVVLPSAAAPAYMINPHNTNSSNPCSPHDANSGVNAGDECSDEGGVAAGCHPSAHGGLYRAAIGSAAAAIIRQLSAGAPASPRGPSSPTSAASSPSSPNTATATSDEKEAAAMQQRYGSTPFTTFMDTLVTANLRRSGDEASAGPRAHLVLLQHLQKVHSEQQQQQQKQGEGEGATPPPPPPPTFRPGIIPTIFAALLRCHPWFNLAEAGSALVLTGCMATIPNLYQRLASVLAELGTKYMLRRDLLTSEIIAPFVHCSGDRLLAKHNSSSATVATSNNNGGGGVGSSVLPPLSKLEYLSVFAKCDLSGDSLASTMEAMRCSAGDGGGGKGGGSAGGGAGFAWRLALEDAYVSGLKKYLSEASASSSTSPASDEDAHHPRLLPSHELINAVNMTSAAATAARLSSSSSAASSLEPTISPFSTQMLLAIAETRIRDVIRSMKIIPPSVTPPAPSALATAAGTGATPAAAGSPPVISTAEYPFLVAGRALPSVAAVVGAMAVYGSN